MPYHKDDTPFRPLKKKFRRYSPYMAGDAKRRLATDLMKAGAATQTTATTSRLLEIVTPALALPGSLEPKGTLGDYRIMLADENMARNVVWLAFCGLYPEEIVSRTGYTLGAVKGYLVSDEYRALREGMKATMLARVNEALRERLTEVVLEAVEMKIRFMRTHSDASLRNRIATELIELGREAISLGSSNVTDLLKAIHEQAVRERDDGTRITTERVTLQGSPEVVAAALRSSGRGNGHPGDSPAARSDDRAGQAGAGDGTPEAALAPGEPGGDETDGHGGVQSG